VKRTWQLVGITLGGLGLGLALGLLYAWVLAPVQYVDTAPASLRADFKDQFRIMIAAAQSANGNLPRAQTRLALLGDPDPAAALMEQSRRSSGQAALALAGLAQAIGPSVSAEPSQTATLPATETSSPLPSASATPVSSATRGPPRGTRAGPTPIQTASSLPSNTPRSTFTPRPTLTPTATAGAPFALVSQEVVCDQDIQPGLLQVEISDGDGKPVAGAEILIAWQGGQESLFTGLKPELGDGYADFAMQAGVVYSLRLAMESETASDLSIPACESPDGTPFGGAIRLEFEQP
jgi:hypothetical protein